MLSESLKPNFKRKSILQGGDFYEFVRCDSYGR